MLVRTARWAQPKPRLPWLAWLGLVWLGLATSARAQTPTALSWVREPGAEGCIAAPELGRKVERAIGPVLTAASAAEISIEGRIAPTRDGFAATLVVTDASGRRLGVRRVEHAANDCRDLDAHLAFILAVSIDPNAAIAELPAAFDDEDAQGRDLLAQLADDPPRPAPPGIKPKAETPTPQPTAPPRAQAPSLRWLAGAGVSAGLGQLPGAAVGLDAGLGMRLGRSELRVQGRWWLPRYRSIGEASGARLRRFDLALSACPWVWTGGVWELGLCGGAQIARVSAEPEGFTGTARAAWLYGPRATLRLGRRLTGSLWLALQAEAQSLWPRQRFSYRAGQLQQLYRTSAVSGALQVALGWHF